ncbi:MAG TPA: undecaprenyl-diphosphate phosphatase [Candidatus Saccharimonadales bacterium]|nr:undecaprenyl-diphosphate phosphatase [Candidatus Saccharimonadales bacterium]
MGLFEAILLGVIEGITEFLPVSSTAHLTITEKLLGFSINDPDIVAFTAIIQVGAVLATLVYFRNDIWRLVAGWARGLAAKDKRGADYRLGWAVLIGSLPIGIVGLIFKDQIEQGVRSLWLVAGTLIIWSGVMWLADRTAKQDRHEKDTTWKDTLVIGLVQCLALVPGVSRSGATISAGLFKGLDRLAITRLSFFLAIPALLAAGVLESLTQADHISQGVGWTATLTAAAVSFFVAYASIAWLLNFVAKHNFNVFVAYRLALGTLLVVLLASGTISAT